MILLEFYAVLIEESLTAKKHRNVRIYEYDGSIKLLRLILYPKRQVTNKAVDWFHRNAHDGSASAGGSIYLERLCDRGNWSSRLVRAAATPLPYQKLTASLPLSTRCVEGVLDKGARPAEVPGALATTSSFRFTKPYRRGETKTVLRAVSSS
jgi:hypothetical protein